jgi:hypothetical protein
MPPLVPTAARHSYALHTVFKSVAKVVEAQWGLFYPIKLAAFNKTNSVAKCSEKTLELYQTKRGANSLAFRYLSLRWYWL